MRRLLSSLCLAVTSALPALSQGEWVRVGEYHNYGVYSTALEARLINSEWDSLAESKRLIFRSTFRARMSGQWNLMCCAGRALHLGASNRCAHHWCSLLLTFICTTLSASKGRGERPLLC